MNDDWGRIWKETVVASPRYCPGIRVEGLRKTTKDLFQDTRPGFEPHTCRVLGQRV
jgi:hypothetical protein